MDYIYIVQEVGLILDKDDTVLAATPDRIATIVHHNGDVEHRNVEIKCLESKQDVSPEVAIKHNQKEASFPFIEKKLLFWSERKTNIGFRLRCRWESLLFLWLTLLFLPAQDIPFLF